MLGICVTTAPQTRRHIIKSASVDTAGEERKESHTDLHVPTEPPPLRAIVEDDSGSEEETDEEAPLVGTCERYVPINSIRHSCLSMFVVAAKNQTPKILNTVVNVHKAQKLFNSRPPEVVRESQLVWYDAMFHAVRWVQESPVQQGNAENQSLSSAGTSESAMGLLRRVVEKKNQSMEPGLMKLKRALIGIFLLVAVMNLVGVVTAKVLMSGVLDNLSDVAASGESNVHFEVSGGRHFVSFAPLSIGSMLFSSVSSGQCFLLSSCCPLMRPIEGRHSPQLVRSCLMKLLLLKRCTRNCI